MTIPLGDTSDVGDIDDDEEELLLNTRLSVTANSATDRAEVSEEAENSEESDSDPTQNEAEFVVSSKSDFRWRRKKPPHENTDYNGVEFQAPDRLMSAYEYFLRFVDQELIDHVTFQSNLYSVQQTGRSCNVTTQEISTYFGILLRMGIVRLPQYRMYWGKECRIPGIADSMTVNRFDQVKRFLHFMNNEELLRPGDDGYDRLQKVRPLLTSFLEKCRGIEQEECQSIDEQIIPTKSRSSLRQYLPKKPHKWGYKVWARCGVTGILYDFEIYCGKNGRQDGRVESVILRLSENLPRQVNHKLFFDNYFSTMSIIQKLHAEGVLCLGTVRNNRLMGADRAMKSRQQLESEGRGSFDYSTDANSGVCVVRWIDNGMVQLLSSYIGPEEDERKITRWSTKEKKKIEIKVPKMVTQYNLHMGGVDLCDMLMSLYRIPLRSTKWYMPILYYVLNAAVVNSWLLYRRDYALLHEPEGKQSSLLQFQSEISEALILSNKVITPRRNGPGRPPLSSSPFNQAASPLAKRQRSLCVQSSDVRFDNTSHWPVFVEKQQRCANCPKGYTYIKCSKCQRHLCMQKCRNCFTDYHASA